MEAILTKLNVKLEGNVMNGALIRLIKNHNLPVDLVEKLIETEEITQQEQKDLEYMQDRIDVWKEMLELTD